MTQDRITPEEIGAFVDGELDAARSADVAGAAARDPRVARQIANVAALKAQLAGMTPDVEIELPAAAPSRPRRRWMVAASVALFVAAGAALLWTATRPTAPVTVAQLAGEAHQRWASADIDGPARRNGGALSIGVPDLSDTKLYVWKVASIRHRGQAILHIAYRGTRGCRLSLFVLGGAKVQAPPTDARPARWAAWRDDHGGYAVLSTGMDAARFDLIVQAIKLHFRDRRPLTRTIRQQLADSRLRAAPCVG